MLLLLFAFSSSPPLTLADAWAHAQQSSPSLRALAADVDGAEAEAGVASRWLPDPTLGLSSDFDVELEGERDLSALLEQELRWPMETSARIDVAAHNTRATRLTRERALVEAWREVASAYVAVAAAVDEQAARVELLALAQQAGRAATVRWQSGDGPEIDAAFAELDVAQAHAAVADADAAVEAARARLCVATGGTCDGAPQWPVLAVDDVDDADIEAAVAARADVRAAEAWRDRSIAAVDAASWQRVPAPTVGVGFGLERSVLNVVDEDPLLLLRLSVPLPAFSLAQGDVAVVEAGRARSEAELSALLLSARQETRAAVEKHRAARRGLTAWDPATSKLAQTLKWLGDGYEKGALSFDALLTGRDRVARARLAYIAARRAEAVAAAEAIAALGRIP